MADAELLARRYEAPIAVERAEVAPPPNTRHIAVRTGKRYGKTSLTARHGRDLARAIAECRYLLRELDPDGTLVATGRVDLITHKDCKPATAEALTHPGTPHRALLTYARQKQPRGLRPSTRRGNARRATRAGRTSGTGVLSCRPRGD